MSKLISELRKAIQCCEGLVAIETAEPGEVILDITAEVQATNKAADGDIEKSTFLAIHDPVRGLCDIDGEPFIGGAPAQNDEMAKLGISPQAQQGEDCLTAVKFFCELARERDTRREDDESRPEDQSLQLLVLKYFDRSLMPSGSDAQIDPTLLSAVDNLRTMGATVRCCAVILTQPGAKLPAELAEYCALIEHELPTNDERQDIIEDLVGVTSLAGTISDEIMTKAVEVTAGLSRPDTERAASRSIITNKTLNYADMQRFKGKRLAKRDLQFWSPDMEDFKLWPIEGNDLSEFIDVTCLAEETPEMNSQVPEGHVRLRVRYSDGNVMKEHWLDPMKVDDYVEQLRPEKNLHSFDNWIGFDGVKDYIRNGFRDGVPDRARMKGLLFVGVPGGGKSWGIKCTAGEFQLPVTSIDAGKLYSKWQGETDKNMSRMLGAVESIGGILDIDEYQQFIPVGDDNNDSGTSKRVGGSLLTWQNDQDSVFIMACANDISFIPPQFTREGRFDSIFIVGFPGRTAKDAAWKMYMQRHELDEQKLPDDENWTCGEIAGCCKKAEQQGVSLIDAAAYVPLCYRGTGKEKIDKLFDWAEDSGCLDAETGKHFIHPRKRKSTRVSRSKSGGSRAPRRRALKEKE